MSKILERIRNDPTGFIIGILQSIIAAAILGILAFIWSIIVKLDWTNKIINLLSSLPEMKISGKEWEIIINIIAIILAIILMLAIIRKISPFIREQLTRRSPTSVSDNDTSDAEIEDVHITEEIQDSWNEIIAAIDDGIAQQRYAVGAYKPLDLGQFGIINMQLAGFNLDDRADGKGKASTTWIAKEILSETHRWNPEWDDDKEGTGTIGGWAKCELRKWMNKWVQPAIPENVRGRLVSVKKSQKCYDTNWNWIQQTTEDSVWIPSRDEVFGDQSLYYGLFRDQRDRRVKTRDGSAAWWWLRSASVNSYASSVYGDGSYYTNHVHDTSGGLVLGFCL